LTVIHTTNQTPFVVEAPGSILTAYPVHYSVARPDRFTRVQLLVRFAVFIVLGMLGLSFATIFALAYLALPVYAAVRIGSLGTGRDYAREDRRRVFGLLQWFASLSAWVGLVAERLPARSPDETVSLTVEDMTPRTTAGSASLRILTGLPSALVLMVHCWLGVFVWLWAAISILFRERVGPGAFAYLVGLQRWSVRLLAYQACLVDVYPPFSLSDHSP
jgi:hypothetical protein